MKKFLIFSLPFYIAGLFYLLLPTPPIVPLSDALRSDEPGDTWQNPDQQAYFSNKKRIEVLTEYSDSFAVKFGGVNFPSYRLNYRPEDTAKYVRPHIDSYYLEEIVHPLRESLFINGWEPQNSPIHADKKPEDLEELIIVVDGQTFISKVTLKPYYSSEWARLLSWTLIFPSTYFTFKTFTQSLISLRNSSKRK